MTMARRLELVLPLAALLVLAVACDTGDDSSDADEIEAAAAALSQLGGGQQGIQVNGIGTVAMAPDVALLALGVETMADTVADARGEAAAAMTAIMVALQARGIEDSDIQTSFLNISPEYTYQEMLREGARINERVLVGYRVNNNVVVKLRDLDAVGEIVDEVAQAGGNATRVESIRFSAEDTTEARRLARERAVMDAVEKADQLATHTGVTRGNLVSVSESFQSAPVPRNLSLASDAMMMEQATTPISAGELEITVNVHAVFEIEGR